MIQMYSIYDFSQPFITCHSVTTLPLMESTKVPFANDTFEQTFTFT